MEKILREVLATDKSLLGRRDELIAALEGKVPGNLRRDFAPIKKAISLNVGEKFLVGEQDKDKIKEEVAEILKSSGMQAARIDFVIETFIKALEWDKPPVREEKAVPAVSLEKKAEPADTTEKSPPVEPPQTPPVVTTQSPTPEQITPPNPNQSTPPPADSKNKKAFIGLICVVLLLLFVAGGNKSNNTSAPSQQNSQVESVAPEDTSYLDALTDLSLNGLDLGISAAEAEKKLGKPRNIEHVGNHDRYIYSDTFYISVEDGIVTALVSRDSKFKTLRGLHVGSTYGEVVDKYGTNSYDMTADGLNLYEYEFGSLDGDKGLLRFAVNGSGLVDYISVRITEPPALGVNWIKDANGVYLWNPQPQDGETITWSGSYVKDGKYKFAEGEGIVTWYLNGEVAQTDEGTFRRGQRHGRFTHRFPSGRVLYSNWDNGVEIQETKSDIDENVRQAATAFLNYHTAITNKNFSAAFNLFTDERKSDMNYNVRAFADGYSTTISSEITDLNLVSNSGNRVVMNYILDARDRASGGKTLYQQFSGQVEMVRVNGEWKIAYTESKRIKEIMER